MTADANWSTGRSREASEQLIAAAPHHGNAPQDPGSAGSAAETTPADGGHLDSLLHNLIERIEGDDRRNGDAREDLHARLDPISPQAGSAHDGAGSDGGEPPDRVETQVAALAERVREADAARRSLPQDETPSDIESRLDDFMAPIEEPAMQPEAELAPTATDFDHQFQNMTERLEQSLAASPPANQVETMSSQMDDASQRAEVAPEPDIRDQTVKSVEAQLRGLSAQFERAEEQFGRMETIEGHLLRLMDMMQTPRSEIDEVARKTAQETVRVFSTEHETAQTADRLGAIQSELHSLNDRARRMDECTVDTLEAMNGTLKTLAERVGVGDSGAQTPVAPEPEPVAPAPQQPPAGGHAEVRIEAGAAVRSAEQPGVSPAANAGHGREAEMAQRPGLGAEIPDYQPIAAESAPYSSAPVSSAMPAQGAPAGDQPMPDAGAGSPGHGPGAGLANEDDFIASARRAAQAAAVQAHEAPSRKGFFSRFKRNKTPAPPARPVIAGETKSSRSLLVFAAVFLLLVSAVLLYGRLKTKGVRPFAATPQQSAPAPAAPAAESRPATRGLIPQPPSKQTAPAAAEPASPANRTGTARKRSLVTNTSPKADKLPEGRFAVAVPESAETGADVAPARQTEAKAAKDKPVAAPPTTPSSKRTRRKAHVETPLPGLTVQIVEPTGARQTSAPSTQAPAGTVKPVIPGARSIPLPPASVGPISLRTAASKGDAAAQFEVATRFAEGKGVDRNYVEAARWYKRAAALGLAPAQYRLGAFYERGRGLKEDLGRARLWYRRAAEQGNIKAMHNLAVTYTARNGRGPDYATAAQWFEKAARHGLSDSQFNLGILFQNGLGVRKSLSEAYRWFALAAAGGDPEAEKRRKPLKLQILPNVLKRIEHAVRNWKAEPVKKAANTVSKRSGSWRSAKQTGNAKTARVQTLLNQLGYLTGKSDGRLGPKTQAAIRAFEKRSGLAVTGKVNDRLIKRLESLAG
ncbi:MAG: peptidoglycan-binding protein [Methyloligellaceae bacterium]